MKHNAPKMASMALGLVAVLLTSPFNATNGQGQGGPNEPVIVRNPDLPVVATLMVAPDGSQAIVFNPNLCDEAGSDVCGFYLAHEFAHIAMKHAVNNVPTEISEPEADCVAAKAVPQKTAIAAYNWFMNGAPSPQVHGSSALRAAKIRACAGF